jgi:rod shape-determining protein MreC
MRPAHSLRAPIILAAVVTGAFMVPVVWVSSARFKVLGALAPALAASGRPLAAGGEDAPGANEVDCLRKRVRDLENENEEFKTLLAQHKYYQDLLKTAGVQRRVMTAARIIGRGANWSRGICLIDRGWNHGVRPGQGVVAGDCAIGVVHEVGADLSRVLLLTQSTVQVPAKIRRTQRAGLLVGDGSETVRLDHIPRSGKPDEPDLVVGDEIIASGLMGQFLPGAHLGVVESFEMPETGLAYRVRVRPGCDLARTTVVLVLGGDAEPNEDASLKTAQ